MAMAQIRGHSYEPADRATHEWVQREIAGGEFFPRPGKHRHKSAATRREMDRRAARRRAKRHRYE